MTKIRSSDGHWLSVQGGFPEELAEAILDDRFAPSSLNGQMIPWAFFQKNPNLVWERRQRAHRRAYRAHLETLRAQRSSSGGK